MSYKEAIYDGIETYYDKHYACRGGHGCQMYKIPCEKCGKIMTKTQYSRKRTYLCDYCKGLIRKKKELLLSDELMNVETKAEKRFNKAVEEIKKQVKDFSKYEKAISIAKTREEHYGSIPETMVAIELLKLKYKIIPQQKIDKYKVDFAIPDQKMIIEVDGEIFHKDRYKNDREAVIQLTLGFDWKIVHIPAELIRKDITKLKQAINVYI